MLENTIKTVAIVGAGAMGAAYASMFSRAPGFHVYFIARGARFQRLAGVPLVVNDTPYDIAVKRPEDILDPPDLVLVALKHHHLASAVNDIRSITGPQTIILSVMNGLESERIIGAACGMDKILYAIAVGIDAVHEGGRYSYARPGRILFGPGPQSAALDRAVRLREALERAAIPCEIPDDMQRVMWWKFMINVGINQASAVLRAPYGIFQISPDAHALMRMLMQEVVDLAGRLSICLTEKDLEDWLAVLSTLSPDGKTSMLQDIEAGRKTEVEIFAGTVVALGREHQMATPVNETILHILKVLENRSQ